MNLLNRLGVRPPPPDGFDLINIVQPVSLVDSDIVLPVSFSSILLDLPFTAGYLLNPVAATIQADTGPQPFGIYNIDLIAGIDAPAPNNYVVEIARRNAANAADIWAQLFTLNSANGGVYRWQARIQLQTSERLVVRNRTTLAASGNTVSSNIWLSV